MGSFMAREFGSSRTELASSKDTPRFGSSGPWVCRPKPRRCTPTPTARASRPNNAYLGLPAALAVLVIFLELVGAIGLFTRPAALCIGAFMVGASGTVHVQHGLFVNWSGNKLGEGFEYHLLLLAMVLVILIGGSGRGGLDRTIASRLTCAKPKKRRRAC